MNRPVGHRSAAEYHYARFFPAVTSGHYGNVTLKGLAAITAQNPVAPAGPHPRTVLDPR
ncbi:hypothetical protein GCM10010468_01250 [Actinocorallia longicatena]|uniref:Uncharacterized protein n=1 Tax=Actinocorallia longicatena TaxID=111803 RepID=A0ABP6PXX5_9ACTN